MTALDYNAKPAEAMSTDVSAVTAAASGSDHSTPELRQRYAGYFSRYIQERFVAEGA